MKKILHIPKYYPPHTGGIEYTCHKIVTHLTEFAHAVICFNDKDDTKTETYEGVRITRVGARRKVAGQALSIKYFHFLKKEIKLFQPDIIHFHAPNPLVSLYLLMLIPRTCKLVVHFHAEILTSRMLYQCYRPVEQILLRRADRILTTSPKFRDEVLLLAPYRSKCTVIESIISTVDLDLDKKDYERINSLKHKYHDRKIILSFGRHVSYKGLQYLIEAEPYIDSDCEIIIGGNGPLTESLKQMSHSSRIHFIGRIPDDELRIYLHAAYVFAFPSITKAEAFGLTLAQSMYCGTPAVTFTIPESGVNYVTLDEITGLEVENGNVRAFALAINRLLGNESLHDKLAVNGCRRVVDNFTMGRIKVKLSDLYKTI